MSHTKVLEVSTHTYTNTTVSICVIGVIDD